jgi:hypothetical protein
MGGAGGKVAVIDGEEMGVSAGVGEGMVEGLVKVGGLDTGIEDELGAGVFG